MKKPLVTNSIYWPRGVRLSVYDEGLNLIGESRDRTYDLNDNLFQAWGNRTVYLGVAIHSKNWPVWDAESLEWIEERIVWDLESDGNEVNLARHTRRRRRPCSEEFIWQLDVS